MDSTFPTSNSLRLLSIDGGGVKGLTALLILKRIMRTVRIEGNLAQEPRPCEVFDLIAGNSTGGLISVMLGRLRMSVDEAIAAYKRFGQHVFGAKPIAGNAGKLALGAFSKSFYSVSKLQEAIREIVKEAGLEVDEPFLEKSCSCKTMVCVIRKETSVASVLRNFETEAADQENYDCTIWEAGSATAAAPIIFEKVNFKSGVVFVDGGLRRNNPINELVRETESIRSWQERDVGCIVSLGTGWTDPSEIPARLDKFLKRCVEVATDSDDVADQFARSPYGKLLIERSSYFRFSVQQGMTHLQMDDWKETDLMDGLTSAYLGKPENSTLVERCARSMLYPSASTDESHHFSWLPYDKCHHFVCRQLYEERLEKAFIEDAQSGKIFVLWGLGGVGKTQIALQFALAHRKKRSVFWIRADRPENFLADYRKVLELILTGPEFVKVPSNDPNLILTTARDCLEACNFKWLLVLDNADNIESFRQVSMNGIRLQDFLPRGGWILITTRDSRLVGQVSSAKDGMKVRPMREREAKELLLKSVPADLAVKGHYPKNESEDQASDFVNELGLLPLAIAQAAANIRHIRTPLSSYIALYDQKKSRMELLEQSVQDLRMPPQSVLLTWQISFDHIQQSNPAAAKLLSYMAFLHWQSVPMELLKACPQVVQLNEIGFLKAVGELLNLSLLEETDTEGFSIHPMVHYWLSIRLMAEERSKYLREVLNIMAVIFPVKSYEEKPLCRYLLPHALKIIDQAAEMNIEEKLLARLMQCVAYFLMWAGISSWSVALICRALDMGEKLWSAEDMSLIYLRKYKGRCLARANRHEEAVVEFRKCLQDLATIAEASDLEKASERFHIRENMVTSLLRMGEPGVKEAAEMHEADLEETRHRIGENHSNSSKSEQTLADMVTTHNKSTHLIDIKHIEEAMPLVDEVLKWAEHEGKGVVSEEILLRWYNSHGDVLRGQGRKEEALAVYADVLERSRKIRSSQDNDLWIALLNVSSSLYDLRRFGELQQLVLRWMETIPEKSIKGSRLEHAKALYNIVAISYQKQWRLEEAEKLHRIVLEWDTQDSRGALDMETETGSPSFHIYVYNLCLCLARQQKSPQLLELQAKYASQLEQAESRHDNIQERLRQDVEDVAIYEEARSKVTAGITITEDPWYLENKKALERGEDRFGSLDAIEKSRLKSSPTQLRKGHSHQWTSLRKLVSRKKKDGGNSEGKDCATS